LNNYATIFGAARLRCAECSVATILYLFKNKRENEARVPTDK